MFGVTNFGQPGELVEHLVLQRDAYTVRRDYFFRYGDLSASQDLEQFTPTILVSNFIAPCSGHQHLCRLQFHFLELQTGGRFHSLVTLTVGQRHDFAAQVVMGQGQRPANAKTRVRLVERIETH
ncbi:hypothetical protein D3C78_1496260 [compost metagenome]